MFKNLGVGQRAIRSAGWATVGNAVQVVVSFLRSIVLARLLDVTTFGTYGFAGSIVSLTATIAGFGLAGAFLHRSKETQDENHAASVYFTLSVIFGFLWGAVLGGCTIAFAEGDMRTALLVLIVTQFGAFLNQVPRTILVRRVVHRRLALLQLLDVLLSSATAVILALSGVELWALLITNVVTLVASTILLYLWRPIWRPRLVWCPTAARYFVSFGAQTVAAGLLSRALDRMDDLWTGSYLGDLAMGLYSKAYTFATYPRTVLATPINKVASGTYAELASNRKQLSQAFFRTNAVLVRSGFLFAGLLALLAPEFIYVFIGTKWLPMLGAFRLMLVFTLLDPIRVTVEHLFIAVGDPSQLIKAHIWQLLVMIAGLVSLGSALGISGVALAVDLMVITGMAILLRRARMYVDFSLGKLFLAPFAALILGLLVSLVLQESIDAEVPSVLIALIKASVFPGLYLAVLLMFERRYLTKLISFGREKLIGDG